MRVRLRVGALADLPPGAACRHRIGDRTIAFFNVAGSVFAVDDRCPHEGGRLSGGSVESHAVRCPVHGACFDLATGRTLEPPAGEAMGAPVDRGVRSYLVTVIDGEVYVDL